MFLFRAPAFAENDRYASPNERRVIAREDLDFYRFLVVGGIYSTREATYDITSKSTYTSALQHCIQKHPALSFIVKNPETERPFYTECPITNFEDHVEMVPVVQVEGETDAEFAAIQQVLPGIMDANLPKDRPAWKIVVLPFLTGPTGAPTRCFIAFAFSHVVGDGISGLAFHKTFLAGLRNPPPSLPEAITPKSLVPAFDTAKTLPISWGFFLVPALGTYLPKFLASALGFRAAANEITPTTWLGAPVFHNKADHRTGVRVCALNDATITAVLRACKSHNTKFTPLFHQLILQALSTSLPAANSQIDAFVSTTALNMRHLIGVSNDQIGLYVSGFYDMHSRPTSPADIWDSARVMGEKLHACASTLQDQAIGLLRYLPSIHAWTAAKIGSVRDGSYEVSNLLVFDPEVSEQGGLEVSKSSESNMSWNLGDVLFSQPGNAPSAPMTFNLVSRKGGSFVCVVSWQVGALAVGSEEEEHAFVEKVWQEIERQLVALS